MKILVTGATGFVGKRLVQKLVELGHELLITTRNKDRALKNFDVPVKAYQWDFQTEDFPSDAVNETEVVINLMGENISSKRWSQEQKEILQSSRILATKKIVEGVNSRENNLKLFIQASAIGFYPVNTGEVINEKTNHADNFLAKLCRDWEEAAKDLQKVDRKLVTRIGVVLGEGGGALDKLLPIFKLGAGGPIGSGSFKMSWIHIDDLIKIFVDALENESYSGTINAVAPQVVTNKEFTKSLGKVLSRPTIFPVPPFMLKLIYGEMSTIMLDGQEITSRLSTELDHKFLHPNVCSALEEVVKLRTSDKSGKKKDILV